MNRITVQPDGASAEAGATDTILAALTRAGYRYRIGCRRGGCGVCKVLLLAGEVRYERPIAESVLSADERAEGVCVSCRAVPLTNVVMELQDGDRLRQAFPSSPPPSGAPHTPAMSGEPMKGTP